MVKKFFNACLAHKPLLIILLVGLLFRLWYLYTYAQLPDWEQLTVDNNFHHHWALSIHAGNILGDTTYFRAPFYIFYLASLYKLFGISLWAVRLAGVVLGLLSILLTYKISLRLFEKKSIALVAAFFQAIIPIVIYFESELLLDAFFTLLFQAHLYYWLRWWDERKNSSILLSGLFFGLACITRPTPLVFLPLILITIFLLVRTWPKRTTVIGMFLLTTALCIFPVSIRNYIVAEDPVLIASQGGINLFIGNNDNADGISAVMPEPLGFNWRIKQISHIAELESGRKMKQGEVSSYWQKKAVDWITDNPGRFIELFIEKMYHSISNREVSNNRYLDVFFDRIPLFKYNPLSFGIMFSLALFAVIITGSKNKKVLYFIGILLIYIFMSSFFFFSSRFRMPLLPIYFALAAYGAVHLQYQIRQHRKNALFSFSCLVIAGLISFYPIVPLPQGSPSHHLISRGIYHSAQGEYQQALAWFKQAKQLDPTLAETDLNIGATYLSLGVRDSALHYLALETNNHTERVKAYINIASIHYLDGNYAQAKLANDKALAQEPYNVTAATLASRIFFADTTATSSELKRNIDPLLRATGNNIYLLNDIAAYYTSLNLLREAQEVLLIAIDVSPPPIETDDEAFQHQSRNRPEAWRKQQSQAYYQLGYINGLRGQFQLAIANSQTALDLDSTNQSAYVNLISGYLSTGQIASARSLLSEALIKFPGNQGLLQIKQYLQ